MKHSANSTNKMFDEVNIYDNKDKTYVINREAYT